MSLLVGLNSQTTEYKLKYSGHSGGENVTSIKCALFQSQTSLESGNCTLDVVVWWKNNELCQYYQLWHVLDMYLCATAHRLSGTNSNTTEIDIKQNWVISRIFTHTMIISTIF